MPGSRPLDRDERIQPAHVRDEREPVVAGACAPRTRSNSAFMTRASSGTCRKLPGAARSQDVAISRSHEAGSRCRPRMRTQDVLVQLHAPPGPAGMRSSPAEISGSAVTSSSRQGTSSTSYSRMRAFGIAAHHWAAMNVARWL